MKVLDYSDIQSLTCDNTFITCDNTIITCDMITIPGEVEILVIPREMVDIVYVKLYNELTFETTQYSVAAVQQGGYLRFAIVSNNIKEGDSYELTVTKDSFDGKLLYRDKAYATTNQDLKNYKLNNPDANGIIIV